MPSNFYLALTPSATWLRMDANGTSYGSSVGEAGTRRRDARAEIV